MRATWLRDETPQGLRLDLPLALLEDQSTRQRLVLLARESPMTRPQASILSRLVQWSAADRRRYSTRRSENALAGVSDRGSGGIWKISRVSAPPGPRKTALCLLCKSVESRPCPPCSHDLSLSPAELAITSYQFSPCLPSRGPADWIGDSSLGAEQHVCRIIRHRLELSPCSLQWAPWPWVGPLQSPPSLGPPSSPEQTATVHLPTWYRTSNLRKVHV